MQIQGDQHQPTDQRDTCLNAGLHGRAILPFYNAPHGVAGHDLLVMNHHPDLTADATTGDTPTVYVLSGALFDWKTA